MHGHSRHPFLDNLVVGLAILLALVLLYYGARTVIRHHTGADQWAQGKRVSAEDTRPGKHELDITPTESGVSQTPPVNLSKLGRRARKAEVPPPL
jgi:hypothetical protein